jgi:cytochrome c peroxidase
MASTSITRKSALNLLTLLVLFSWNVCVPTAQGANPATIRNAEWRTKDQKLVVKGKLAPQGTTVTVSEAGSGNILGTAVANDRNIWRLVVKNLAVVPCSVQAETGGNTHVKAVKNAPSDCGSVAEPPPETTDPIDPPIDPIDPPPDPVGTPVDPVDPLVEQGEALFFNETFAGNGRTCGTCHRAENNFTIDPVFIASLPPDDPLFISESNPDLADLEDSTMLREFGLIRANADGFDNPTAKFVVRSVSHLFGLASSVQSNATEAPFQMTGWSGDGAPGSGTLRDFSTGAVVQHFTRTLDRVEGADFRLPTDAELDALEAFMLSLGVPATLDLQALRLTNPAAETGRVLFITEDSENGSQRAAKCNACHRNAGALTVAGINQNFNTGVEDAVHAADDFGALRPRDGGFGTQLDATTGGFGDGTFNPVPLVHAADTAPFFHNNVAATLEDAIAHYESNEFRTSPEGQRLLLADSGGQELTVDVDALAAFLRVINMMENIRSSVDHLSRAKTYVTTAGIQKILTQATVDLDDVLKVLAEGMIHEDVVPHIDNAKSLLASAMAEPIANVDVRNNFIDQAITAAEAGSGLMVAVLPAIDTTAPTVAITAPAAGTSLFGSVNISANASDDTAVVIFKVGATQIGQDSLAPFDMALNTTAFSDGNHLLTVTAIDSSNNSASATLAVVIDNASVTPPADTTNPTVEITAPSSGDSVSGNVTVSADAGDITGVTSVVFSIDGTEIGQLTTPPYAQVWDTEAFAEGGHSLVVTAFDAAGNSTSSSISVVVDNSSGGGSDPVCTVYSCPNPPPPPSEPPPDPVTPSGSSPDGEFEGEVTNVDLQASTVSIDSGGQTITVQITTDTEFMGSIATGISQILIGHVAQGEFFKSTSETVWIEADLPAGF